jgi:hypothetical protein
LDGPQRSEVGGASTISRLRVAKFDSSYISLTVSHRNLESARHSEDLPLIAQISTSLSAIHGLNIDLGTLGGDNSWTNYGGINDRGEVVGMAETYVPDPNGEDMCAFGTKKRVVRFFGNTATSWLFRRWVEITGRPPPSITGNK